MNIKNIGYAAAGLIGLILIGAIAYKQFSPTNKTVVSSGGKLLNIYADNPSTPIIGCHAWRIEALIRINRDKRTNANTDKPTVTVQK